jgi:hypothetical protein
MVLRALLADASVFMTRPEGPPPSDMMKQLRLTELAKLGLAQGRRPLRDSDLRYMFWEKLSNPMLGLLGAWLLFATPNSELSTVEMVLEELERVIPDHTDVLALRLAWELRIGTKSPNRPRFQAPPLLLQSWQSIVAASVSEPSIVAQRSLADRIGHGFLGGGPWLVWSLVRPLLRNQSFWKHPIVETVTASAFSRLTQLSQAFGGIIGMVMPFRRPASPETLSEALGRLRADLTLQRPPLEPGLLTSLTPLQRVLIREVAARPDDEASGLASEVVVRLKAPSTTLAAATADLLRKLQAARFRYGRTADPVVIKEP